MENPKVSPVSLVTESGTNCAPSFPNILCSSKILKCVGNECMYSLNISLTLQNEVKREEIEKTKLKKQIKSLVGGGGSEEKGRKTNMVQIMYAQVCKCKNDTC
jgi:hypothetical protein